MDPDRTIRAADTSGLLPPEVQAAAANASCHFGPRDATGRPKYYKLRALGQGGMGSVVLAWETHLNRTIALKFLLGTPTDESVKRFRREAQACAALRHPHIVSIHDADVWQGMPYIAMDYIEGSTLAALFAQKKYTRADCLRWIAQIARALQAAHER